MVRASLAAARLELRLMASASWPPRSFDLDRAVGHSSRGPRVLTPPLPPPPRARFLPPLGRCEPVLPLHGADGDRRFGGEGIAGKELQHCRLILQQSDFGVEDPAILHPASQGGEPKVPLKAWLVRGVNARRLANVLRFVPERIRDPRAAVGGPLEFDLVSRARHDGEESVGI